MLTASEFRARCRRVPLCPSFGDRVRLQDLAQWDVEFGLRSYVVRLG